VQDLIDSPYGIAAALVVALMICHEAGYQIGRRAGPSDADYQRRVDMIRNAIVALVTFLVGFSFAAAGSRFIDRQDMMVKETNAIGTAWLRAMTLGEPQRSVLQKELHDYAAERVVILRTYGAELQRLIDGSGQRHKRMWQAGLDGTGGNHVLATLVLPPLNDVIDIHSEHVAMARRRIPPPILLIIIIGSAIGLGMIGYDNGLRQRRYFKLSATFAVVSAAALWMTVDLDRPRHGLLRISDRPYVELLESMK